ncbi:sugar phosphate isomerase/epimerase family protein [Ruania halotolerans]|uniref:sugar phosphate isomerase/epimerase family protein n=1 Tax=Ruania halotolerans TaxID=2897773 RepID=UPI001E466FAB|nr:sugar phosphate isomerase/epimerase family protein [Ruania halotolerans]UFU06329.1 sugar phosphate isomerase/epimerase [Ruania halotolerans]
MFGLGTYAFFWQLSDRNPRPMTLPEAFQATRDLGIGLHQICDYAPLEQMDDAELADAAAAAQDLDLVIELGTKGIDPGHLARFLEIAAVFDATLIRTMIYGPDSRPTLEQARQWLTETMPAFEAAGVTLALETYEQLPTTDLLGLVEGVGSENLGICLDPGNVVARLENPQACVEQVADLTRAVHVKDYAFARQPGWVGFTYSGAPMGEGLHDYPHLLRTVRPRERGINEVVEHWLPWQDDPETTIRTEREWTRTAVDYLRSTT